MKIATRIMWYSKERPKPTVLAESLSHPDFDVAIIEDAVGMGPWHTARRAWLDGVANESASHVLVLADDALPCAKFCEVLLRALETRPNSPVGLFALKELVERFCKPAFDSGIGWIDTNVWCNGVALLLPREMAREYIEFCDEWLNGNSKDDEMRMVLFATCKKLWISLANPSLIEHHPDFVTTAQNKISNSKVVAYNFAGDKAPGLVFDTKSLIVNADAWQVISNANGMFHNPTKALLTFAGRA